MNETMKAVKAEAAVQVESSGKTSSGTQGFQIE